MTRLALRVPIVAVLVLAGGVVAAGSASAATTTPAATSLGYDVSFPQCGGSLPTSPGFAVVGVNDGRPYTTNPCLATELQWANTSLAGAPAFYVNTAQPGPTNNTAWPTGQQSPQVCTGGDSTACSYDFGWNAAQQSFQGAVAAETLDGATSPSSAAAAAPWWLDVETGNSWESTATANPSTASFLNDQATVQGEIAYLDSAGATSVGIYSTPTQWATLMGSTGSTFAATAVWLPGFATLAAAQVGCTATSFTGGRVAMIQYPSGGLDGDYQCPLVSVPVTAMVPVTSSATFSQQLSVAGFSEPVSFTQTSGTPSLVVSPTGLVSTSGALTAGSYVASGTTSSGTLSGSFSFTLDVGLLSAALPTSAATSAPASATFTDQLAVTGASGAVTFTQTSGTTGLVVSPTGLVSTSGALTAGSYVARGTTTDAAGDTGTFAFRLVVGALTQDAPLRATTSASASATFTDQLAVTGASGAVTFTQTSGTPSLVVSPTGLVSTSGALTAGSYVASGTTVDAVGDTGTFTLTLVVAPPPTPTVVTPHATRVIGYAVTGATTVMRITGVGFTGRPVVRSHPGVTALVTADNGHLLTVRVRTAPHTRAGVFTFTITLANHTTLRVRYVQRAGRRG